MMWGRKKIHKMEIRKSNTVELFNDFWVNLFGIINNNDLTDKIHNMDIVNKAWEMSVEKEKELIEKYNIDEGDMEKFIDSVFVYKEAERNAIINEIVLYITKKFIDKLTS